MRNNNNSQLYFHLKKSHALTLSQTLSCEIINFELYYSKALTFPFDVSEQFIGLQYSQKKL